MTISYPTYQPQASAVYFGSAGGSANSLYINVGGFIELMPGDTIQFWPMFANGAAPLYAQINDSPFYPVSCNGSFLLPEGVILPGVLCTLVFTGSSFTLQNPVPVAPPSGPPSPVYPAPSAPPPLPPVNLTGIMQGYDIPAGQGAYVTLTSSASANLNVVLGPTAQIQGIYEVLVATTSVPSGQILLNSNTASGMSLTLPSTLIVAGGPAAQVGGVSFSSSGLYTLGTIVFPTPVSGTILIRRIL